VTLGFYIIMAAQFFSSLADNALLVAAIALLIASDAPSWLTPYLKFFFVVSYVLLAPYVGAFADRLPKGQVMLTSNLRVGEWRKIALCQDVYFKHMQCVVFKKIYTTEESERQGKYSWVAEHVGLDPHFAHANMFADVALARIGSPAHPRQV